MILTHIWICGRAVWRLVTIQQWHALLHLGRVAWKLKLTAIAVPIVCAGSVFLPPLWVMPEVPSERPLVMERPWTDLGSLAPSGPAQDVPEPGTLAIFAMGVGALMIFRRRV